MDLDRISAEDGAVAPARERLAALDGEPVYLSMLRAKELRGTAVLRRGTLHLVPPRGPALPIVGALPDHPLARVIDADGVVLATLLEGDALDIDIGPLRAWLRPSFRIDIAREPFPAPPESLPDFAAATRDIAAELEAAFRTALIVRPDPDPAAGLRADRGLPPIDTAPLRDRSVRFAVGHFSAVLRPDGKASIRLHAVATSIRGVRQFADVFEPRTGALYALLPSEIEGLAAAVRAFLSGRRDRFVERA